MATIAASMFCPPSFLVQEGPGTPWALITVILREQFLVYSTGLLSGGRKDQRPDGRTEAIVSHGV